MESTIKQDARFIAFATQKGGVGKSVFTILTASMLHYKLGYNVVIVDCDFPQYSIFQMRDRDIEAMKADEAYSQMYDAQQEQLQKPLYTILCSPAENAIEVVNTYLESCETRIDVIIFDLPGTIKSKGILQCIACMDYIFTPITSDKIVLESSLSFAVTVKQMLVDNPDYTVKDIHLFWNMVDERERTHLYDLYNESIAEIGLHIMTTTLPDTKRFRKELHQGGKAAFRSTIFPPNTRMLRGSRFDHLLEEIIKTINLSDNE
ncbi:MAG: ParA family protein [Rikenellaceae bacterium]